MKLPKDKHTALALMKKGKAMAYKHRTLLVLLTLIVMNVFIHTGNAQEDAYSVRLGKADAPNELLIYFSLGCSHCLTYFDRHNQDIKSYVDRGLLKVELVEVSGMVDNAEDKAAYEKAMDSTVPVSKVYACITEENPDMAFEYMRRFVKSAKVALYGSDLPWNKWPYAKTEDLNPSSNSPYFNAEAENVQAELAKLFFLDSDAKGENCFSAADDKRLSRKVFAQFKRFIDTDYEGVPVVILNGEYVPPKKHRSMFLNISSWFLNGQELKVKP